MTRLTTPTMTPMDPEELDRIAREWMDTLEGPYELRAARRAAFRRLIPSLETAVAAAVSADGGRLYAADPAAVFCVRTVDDDGSLLMLKRTPIDPARLRIGVRVGRILAGEDGREREHVWSFAQDPDLVLSLVGHERDDGVLSDRERFARALAAAAGWTVK